LIGNVEVQIKVDRNGEVSVLEMVDLNNLGFDFWFSATDAVISTAGKWDIATYNGEKVPAAYTINIAFLPETGNCGDRIESYKKAIQLANESQDLFEKEEVEAGFDKINQAIELFPEFPEFLFIRGQAFLNQNIYKNACDDFSLGQSIGSVNWYDSILSLICAKQN